MKEIGVGVLGFGTVGAGVVQGLLQNGELLKERTGLNLVLKKVADLDIETDRGVAVPSSMLTTDASEVINSPDVDIVVELIGGTTVARAFTLQALRSGKPVVTANKALLAEHGREIYEASADHDADLFYEASVAGGIPIIKALREGLVVNHIESIYGIMNGTCNYILTRMENEGIAFDDVLKQAQEIGYAEAEPSLDIDGFDTAHKAVILASLAYGRPVSMDDLRIEGIRGIAPAELKYAHDLGYRIKLLAVIKLVEGRIDVRVHPVLISLNHPLASVSGSFNAVMVKGDMVGETMFYGRGAGREPTAAAVISDIVDVARNLAQEASGRLPAMVEHDTYGEVLDIGEVVTRCYLRLSLEDEPGVMARVAEVLGRHGISIATLIQKDASGSGTPVVVLTHAARESSYLAALSEIDALDVVTKPTIRLRIEDF